MIKDSEAVRITARFYESRDALRGALTNYEELVKVWEQSIRAEMEIQKTDQVMVAAIKLMMRLKPNSGLAMAMIMAATVEMKDAKKQNEKGNENES